MIKDNLFDDLPTVTLRKIETMPVSVIDIPPQTKHIREAGGHDKNSSRSEYSAFSPSVGSLCYELYLRGCKKIFDPFAGWGERASLATQFGKEYTGIDINQEAINSAAEIYGEKNILCDARDFIPQPFDGLITCPPYWNLEKYTKSGLDGAKTWGGFKSDYTMIFKRLIDIADDGAMFCVQVGDWRESKKYYDLCHVTRSIFCDNGCEPVDEVVLSRKGITKIKTMIPQAVAQGYTVKCHEMLLVFKKPNQADQ